MAEGVAALDLALAISLVDRIGDYAQRGYTIEFLATNAAGDCSRLLALLAQADSLPAFNRQTAFEAIVRAAADFDRPSARVVTTILSQASSRDTETFDRCLPCLVAAAYRAQPDRVPQLVTELDNVARLITA